MTLQQCYTTTIYIAIPARTFMRVVPHAASIRVGERVTFHQLPDTTIPGHYYNLASYEELENRKLTPKPLADYIGRIEHASPVLVRARAGKRIKKVTIQDEQHHLLEITFWTEEMFPYNPEEATGQILVVTSTLVTEYMKKIQLETTDATVAELNPQAPELHAHIHKYCVNATIADETMHAKLVFFNEAMTEMLDTTCRNMVILHGYTDPTITPHEISALRGKPAIFQVTVKNDNSMIVNKVTKSTTPMTRTKRRPQQPPETPAKQARH